jgi:tripartite-type tricarboxylate transporter receptor subunit TctC
MSMVRRLSIFALAGLAASLVGMHAFAQEYPNHVVKVIVPYPVGGATDITARLVAEKLSQKWGVGVIVENKPGVNGVIGTEAVGLGPADGYTIGFVASSHVVNPALYKKLPYALADFKPVTVTTQVQMALVVNAQLPVNSVQELIKYIKDNPAKVNVATSGRGSNPELWALAFQNMTGTRMQDIAYKGSGQAHPDVIGGRVQVMFDAVPSILPHVQSGKMKLLGVGGLKRSPYLPDVPTIAESGVPNFYFVSWAAVIVPAKTPAPVVAKINRDIVDVLRDPSLKDRLAGMSAEVIASSPAEAAAMMDSEEKRLVKLARDVGVEPE